MQSNTTKLHLFGKCNDKIAIKPQMTITYPIVSDYFTKNFQVKENKTKMRNIHLHFFRLLFQGLRLGFELGFMVSFKE